MRGAGGDAPGVGLTAVVTPSPNIWGSPRLYERLNRAADPDGCVAAALDELVKSCGLTDMRLAVDVGCGTGFHLPMLAERVRRVVGVEPHAGLVELARRRVERARLGERVDVRAGSAETLPVTSSTVDLVFSHWAYFFGPGCEPGLAEAERVLRPGGLQVAVDLDVRATYGYASWFAASGTGVRGDRTASFFADRGWQERRLPVVWAFSSRDDVEAVLSIEFPPEAAARAMRETVGTIIAVPTVVRWRQPDRAAGPSPRQWATRGW